MIIFIEEVVLKYPTIDKQTLMLLDLAPVILAVLVILWFLLGVLGMFYLPVYCYRCLTGDNIKDKMEDKT